MKWYLDFGHGGKDSGAVSANKTKESDTVLKIGMLIKNNLEKNNEKVITTREKDLYYSLDYRTSKANKENWFEDWKQRESDHDKNVKNIAAGSAAVAVGTIVGNHFKKIADENDRKKKEAEEAKKKAESKED